MYDELVKSLREDHGKQFFARDMEAADAIEKLDNWWAQADKLIKMLEMPRWIPVSERLPEANAVDKYGFAKGYLVKTDRHVMMHTARYNGEWWILWGKAEVITDTVTHWMPLPQPPKELVGTDMRGGIRRDDAGNVIDWGITGPPGYVGRAEEE